jgi:hypothetical protein
MLIIPVTLEAEIRRIVFQGQPMKNVSRTLPQPIKSGAWWHMTLIPTMQGSSK